MKEVDEMMKLKRFPELADPMRFQELKRQKVEAMRRQLNLEMPELPEEKNFHKFRINFGEYVLRDVYGRFAPPVDPQAPVKKPQLYVKSAFSESNEYMRRLRRRGFEDIGGGAYSTVFTRPGWDKVLKVCRHAQDYWPAYAKWCQQTKSPHAIRVYSIKHHKGFYVAIMEKVNPARGQRKLSDLSSYIGDCGSKAPTMVATSLKNAAIAGQTKIVAKEYPKLPAFLRLVRRLGTDLHAGNWGTREDGTPVIFDPVTTEIPPTFASKFHNTNRFRSTAPRA
ncbi:hypothetical protein [Xanthobacter wiegelii]|uniref:hypothetical protein n=1 Tax=Xanthobacter wiegelii TaxID=3119913 RepID=UPI0037286550